VDRKLYKRHMQDTLFNYLNLDIHVGTVFDLVFSHANTLAASGTSQWGVIEGVKLGKPSKLCHKTPLTYQLQIRAKSSDALK
jgi:tRNA U34 5-carboxymethylaminomethyl modifying enzyme MnmG/GidA